MLFAPRRLSLSQLLPLGALATLAVFSGCGRQEAPASTGSADLSVKTLLSVADVATVTATISGPALAAPRTVTLSAQNAGTWGAVVGTLPVGTNYVFTANANDKGGNTLYTGAATGVSILTGQTITVLIMAQQATAPTPFQNSVPVIDSLFLSSANIVPGATVTATVTAHDPDSGDTLTFAWSTNPAVDGFSASTASTTNWTAPATEGDVTLTVAVTDGHSATASASVVVHVAVKNGTGQAAVTVSTNTWPVVTNLVAAPGYVALGQPVSLTVVASDADGDPLTYAWTSTCASGTFSAATSAATTFMLPTTATDTSCEFDVAVSDGRGGSTAGHTILPVGAPAASSPPVFTASVQSAAFVNGGAAVTFSVTAADPQSSALTFTWLAVSGALSGQTNSANSSQITWAAPTTHSLNYTVSAVATDALGLSTQFNFTITACAVPAVLKSPYLIYPGQNSTMQVIWQDNFAGETNSVLWGSDTSYSLGSAIAPEFGDKQHTYTITGLQPDTKYYYQVKDQTTSCVYGQGSFITAPADSATSIRFIGQGDSRSQPFALDNLMKAITLFTSQPGNADYQRFAIHNGDWVSTDGESYWTNEWFDPKKTDIVAYTANTPIDGVKGNHDNSGGYSTTFPKYFPFPYPNKTLKAGTTATYNNLYWSMDYGPVHITYVDEYSTFTTGSVQYNWIVNDLATTTKPWKFLVYHEPAYSAGSDGDNTSAQTYLEPLITQYNVDLVFAGHSHNYARTGAYNLTQAQGDHIALNVPHITSGGGGAPVYQPDMTNTHSKYPHVITAWPAFEFVTFDIQGSTLTMTAYQVNNVSLTAIQPASALTLSKIETIVLNHFTNLSTQFTATNSTFVQDPTTSHYMGNVTLTNNGADVAGTIDVVLDGILNLAGLGTPDNEYSTANPKLASMIAQNTGLATTVKVVNATGSNNGEPMITASTSGVLAGGQIVVPLEFDMGTGGINPNTATFFTPVILKQ
jgi:predicted phosphodiesterase